MNKTKLLYKNLPTKETKNVKQIKHGIIGIFFLILSITGFSQNVGISAAGEPTDNSAGLDVNFTNKGLLIPRVSLISNTDVATITTPATSLLVYNINSGMTGGSIGYWYWTGVIWVRLSTGMPEAEWLLLGNSGTVDGTNFIGTTDNVALNFKVNNVKAGRIDPAGPTFLGYRAGNSNTAVSNTGIGYNALFSNTTGIFNTANGYNALYSNTTANYNTANGYRALYSNTTGTQNTANGVQALHSSTTGNYNTANGVNALVFNTTGSNNTANGVNALYANTTGSNNTANGLSSLYSNTTGYSNTAVGYQALFSNSTGYGNTAKGTGALYSNTTGIYNTANGLQALYYNTTANNNTGSGLNALYYNTTGNNNTASGYTALQNNTTGGSNTASGYEALITNTTGSNNTAIGYRADVSANNLTNATAIGYSAITGASNSIVLGGTGANQVKVGIGTTTPTRMLDVNGDARIGANGTTVTNIIKVTVVKDVPNIDGESSETVTFTVPNAALASSVIVSPANALDDGLSISYARVSVAGTVEVKFYNSNSSGLFGGGDVNPGSMNFYITVIE